MKSNEITQEGFWDNVAHPIAYAKGAFGGPTTTGAGSVARQQGQDKLTDYAKRQIPAWNQAVVNLQQQGVSEQDLPKHMQAWASKAFEIPMPAYPAPAMDDKVTLEYLKQGWARKWTQQAPAQQPAADPNAAQQGQQGAQQGQQGAQQGQTQQPAQAQQPQVNPAHAIFQDPAKFTAEFNKYLQSTGLQQLVNFKLKDTLKNMWMRSGGTRVESKNNKGKRV